MRPIAAPGGITGQRDRWSPFSRRTG